MEITFPCLWQAFCCDGYKDWIKTEDRQSFVKFVLKLLASFPHLKAMSNAIRHSSGGTQVDSSHFHQSLNEKVFQRLNLSSSTKLTEKCFRIWLGTNHSKCLSNKEVNILWMVFNGLCMKDVYSLKLDSEAFDWILSKLELQHGRVMLTESSAENNNTIYKLLEVVEKSHTSFGRQRRRQLSSKIFELQQWFFSGVFQTGNIHVRSKGSRAWGNWRRCWCELGSNTLSCFRFKRDAFTQSPVIVIPFGNGSLLEVSRPPQDKAALRGYKLKLSSKDGKEYELSFTSAVEKSDWFCKFQEVVQNKTTTVASVMNSDLGTSQILKQLDDLHNNYLKVMKICGVKQNMISNSNEVISSEITNGSDLQDDKLRAIFIAIDVNQNGCIDKDEFCDYLRKIHFPVEPHLEQLLFLSINPNRHTFVYFEQFKTAMQTLLYNEVSVCKQDSIMEVFYKVNTNRSGTLSFLEFAEFVQHFTYTITLEETLRIFNQIACNDKKEVECHEVIKHFLDQKQIINSEIAENVAKCKRQLREALWHEYKAAVPCTHEVNVQIRWNVFINLRRLDKNGAPVMTVDSQTVKDILPGILPLPSLAHFQDITPVPRYASIKGVQWIQSNDTGKSGRLLIPYDFNQTIPVEIATSTYVEYYGACLPTTSDHQANLKHRHVIADFNYRSKYLTDYVTAQAEKNGAGIERHDFSHLNCPLDDDSGILLLGKLCGRSNDELQLTGFKVPKYLSVYIPGGVIHSNDYLKNRWRTMLSDDVIDHLQLFKVQRKGKMEYHEKFCFAFERVVL